MWFIWSVTHRFRVLLWIIQNYCEQKVLFLYGWYWVGRSDLVYSSHFFYKFEIWEIVAAACVNAFYVEVALSVAFIKKVDTLLTYKPRLFFSFMHPIIINLHFYHWFAYLQMRDLIYYKKYNMSQPNGMDLYETLPVNRQTTLERYTSGTNNVNPVS